MIDNEKMPIYFYSSLDIKEKMPTELHCAEFQNSFKSINYPCLIFMRLNWWNDYSHVTNFACFYLNNSNSIESLGIVKIIQLNAPDLKTELPKEFESLDNEKFFFRGVTSTFTIN